MKLYNARKRRGTSIVLLFCFVGLVSGYAPSAATDKYRIVPERGCVMVDDLCLVPDEVPNYEAIKSLHTQLDDDSSGAIDVSESVEFLKEELQYAKGYEKRQKVFQQLSNNDQYVSVQELWHMWKKSEVHNWTTEQTVSWLADSVELQQYAQNFYANAVNGSILPRLAANNEQFLTKVLGIKDPKHRSKITIKAMDVVLFGPPKGSMFKDLVLVTLLTLALIGCFKAYQRNKQYEGQLSDMLRDMEKLKEAEAEMQRLEDCVQKYKGITDETGSTNDKEHNDVVQQLKLQLEQEREKNELMKEQMKRGLEEAELDERHWSAPIDLQHWLQLTFERERMAFERKQKGAREQFKQARDLCEKVKTQRRSIMGMLASANGKMENIDQAISQARTVMEEVTQELRERDQRWKNIEILAGCSITSNAGIHALELMLRPQVNGRPHSTYAPSIVHQLLSSQSALMFLTMGGNAGASGYFGGHNGSGLAETPRESMADVRGVRKRSQLLPRDSGSSLGSDSSAGLTNMHYSSTCPAGLNSPPRFKGMRRSSSTSSLSRIIARSQSNNSESSTEETDGSACISDNTSFSIGGSNNKCGSAKSRMTLNSEISGSVSPVQDQGKISASEPALDSPRTSSVVYRKKGLATSEEGNSSDSSVLDERPPSAESKKKFSKIFFRNGISSSLKLGKSKKSKDTDKDANKNFKSKT